KTARSQAGPAPAAWICLLYHRWKVSSYVHLSIWFADHILLGIARLATHIGRARLQSSIHFATFSYGFCWRWKPYDGKHRLLEIEFRVSAPFAHKEVPLPPPPRVIQCFDVPRYLFTNLTRLKTARGQEQFLLDNIQERYKCQTVRTVCRLP